MSLSEKSKQKLTAAQEKRSPHERAVAAGMGPPDAFEAFASREKSFDECVKELETRLILRALESSDWNKAKAAQQLGLKPNTLHYKIERYGISRDSETT